MPRCPTAPDWAWAAFLNFMTTPTSSTETTWLIRISEVFAEVAEEILTGMEAGKVTRLGNEYFLIKTTKPELLTTSEVAWFARWRLPVQHSWPCNPQKMEGFIEKAAQTMFRKFGEQKPQTVLVGPLVAGAANPYYKKLAANLRGRSLQLFPGMVEGKQTAEELASDAPVLFALVGQEGLFCGVCTPREANGFYPGGTKFISQSAPGAISRAGAKIAEALHYLKLYRPLPVEGCHWLELGASPGGMTSELLTRGYRVTAVDRAGLDQRLDGARGLSFAKADVGTFLPKVGERFDAILSDLNGTAYESIRHVIRLSAWLREGGLVIFTLKTTGMTSVAEINESFRAVTAKAEKAGLKLFARTHLTYNRQEFTLFFEKRGMSMV